VFGPIISIFGVLFGLAYKWLEQNVINYILNFVKGFEHALMMLTVVAFLLITIYIIVKHVRKMPKSYVIEIVDVFGNRVTVDGLRSVFSTYDVAKSYSDLYASLYGKQYKFRVVGRNRIVDPPNEGLKVLPNDETNVSDPYDEE
jgi:hypothetical protein